MDFRRSRCRAITVAISLGLLLSLTPQAEAKSLVGSPCSKLNAQQGDGPNKSIVCKLVGKKKIWQPLSAPKSTANSNSTNGSSSNSTCSKLPQFTADFINPKYVRAVTPIGEQTGGGGVLAVRSYIHPSQDFAGQELPIYAPTDMTLFSSSYYKPAGSADTYQPEYSLYFDAGCGITVKFFHIKGVVGNVASAAPKVPTSSSAGQGVTPTKVKAGEQIGWYKLGENSVAFDFWVDNAAITNTFIVQSHWVNSNALHSVCPYNFYTPEKKAIWLAKLGAPGTDPIPGTSCGTISEGIAGTAQGMWFISAKTQTDDLVLDGPYQSQIMFTTDAGGTIRIGGLNTSPILQQTMIAPNSITWKKPEDVSTGSTYCWSSPQQSIKVHLIDKNSMAVKVGTGSCDELGTAESGRTYQR